ncbi:pyridine nucleotide-disulfide oxidoreductase [Thermithiobacillus plumbiphilus]|uniref:Pyridine nucleotide-disulfide oxidoreductase n=1 Tax=Thermithiobacillus plumbiphilus TaxID=1729899 RepID=A0ABU9D9I3_9PROT
MNAFVGADQGPKSLLSNTRQQLHLRIEGFSYADLYRPERLPELDKKFQRWLEERDEALAVRFDSYRRQGSLTATAESDLLIESARHLEDFLVMVFGLERAQAGLRAQQFQDEPVHAFKEHFVKPTIRKKRVGQMLDFGELDARVRAFLPDVQDIDPELAIARLWQQSSAANDQVLLSLVEDWVWAAISTASGRQRIKDWVSFRVPRKRDFVRLVPVTPVPSDPAGRVQGPPEQWRQRDGFSLTDARASLREVMDQVHYCVFCHDHEGDRCSKGFQGKDGEFRRNPLDVELTGCPLEERISEANVLKRDGFTLGALAVIMIDNPLLPATGHRICNDCMKSCIYQKQEPVDIPQIETRILTDILGWPWGFEVYFLLTRWNPLNRERPYTLPYNGFKVLTVGSGPAGFNLSYHLLQAGFGIAAIDGLKIEPLPSWWTGSAEQVPVPILDINELFESLDSRRIAGFGGVAEYGITVRWDKNFLKLIQLALCRNAYYCLYGGVRFGGTLTVEDAWAIGFDHVALCTGAGKPTVLPMKNHLAQGIRQASDFLMALQLTGAAQWESLANLQVRLPALIIGGGLTAIDTATEVQAYYIRQVEKLLERYEALAETGRMDALHASLDPAQRIILEEQLAHGRQVRQERERANRNGTLPDFISLIHAWGGVTVVYRRSMAQSPAYLRNHEEIEKALQEGIFYAEALSPLEAKLDEAGHVRAMLFALQAQDSNGNWRDAGEQVELATRSVFVAAGSTPNTSYEREHPGTFPMQGRFYAAFSSSADGEEVHPIPGLGHCKSRETGFLTGYPGPKKVSFYGDNHPHFHGSVVKAMASGRKGACEIIDLFKGQATIHADTATLDQLWRRFAADLDNRFSARIKSVERLGQHLVRLTIHAPQATQNWQPGQIFRLQNYAGLASTMGNTRLQMEGVALDGVHVDRERGLITLMVNEVGVSTRIAGSLQPGDPVVLMGPTGTGVPIVEGQHIVVIGHRAAFTSLMDASATWRSKGNHVTFIGHFRDAEAIVPLQELAAELADQLVWVIDQGPTPMLMSPNEICHLGWPAFLRRCAEDEHLGAWLKNADLLLVSDTPAAMRLCATAIEEDLRMFAKPGLRAIAAVTSPMQCMLKEVCAQCLCSHRGNPGKAEKTVFSCFDQHQSLFHVDFVNLGLRQRQNAVHEKLGALWFDQLMHE